MTSQKSPNRLSGRTRIITSASIVAVGLAGLFAIGANLGILSSTDQTKVGTLVATGDLVPPDTTVVDLFLDRQGKPLATDPSTPVGSQRFTVDAAGTVDVSTDGGVASVDLVAPASGWTASPATTKGTGVAITFTNGTRTLHFTATLAADGTVNGDVTESGPTAPAFRSNDHDDSDDHESDDHKSDDHDYEGGDSDD